MSAQVLAILFKTVGAPLLLGILGGLVALAAGRTLKWDRRLSTICGVVFAFIGFLTAYILLNGFPKFPPAARWQYLPIWGLLAMLLAAVEFWLIRDSTGRISSRWKTLVLWILRTSLVITICTVTLSALWNRFQVEPWTPAQSAGMIALFTTITLIGFLLVDRAARVLPAFAFGSAMAAWAGAASLLVLFGANASLSQLAGAFSAGMGGVVLITIFPAARPAVRAFGAYAVPVVLAISLNGLYYSQVLPLTVVLLALALVLLGAGFPVKADVANPGENLRIYGSRLAAGAALLAVAVFLGFQHYTADEEKADDASEIDYESFYGN